MANIHTTRAGGVYGAPFRWFHEPRAQVLRSGPKPSAHGQHRWRVRIRRRGEQVHHMHAGIAHPHALAVGIDADAVQLAAAPRHAPAVARRQQLLQGRAFEREHLALQAGHVRVAGGECGVGSRARGVQEGSVVLQAGRVRLQAGHAKLQAGRGCAAARPREPARAGWPRRPCAP